MYTLDFTVSARDFPALICHPRTRKCIHLQTEGWGGSAQDTEIAAKVSDRKRSLSIIHVRCRLCI
jgi:hypothetical protein